MRFIEARDGFVKIELEGKISLSSFIEVNSGEKTYIAQIVQVKRAGNIAIAYAKLLFLYDGTLKDYDNSIPDKSSKITEFPFDIMSKSFDHKTPIVIGKFIDENIDVVLDAEYFDNSMFICADNNETKNILISAIQNQMSKNQKAFILDTTGKIEGDKYVAGVDFKLPLNTDALNFLYEDCLNDATGDSKLTIKSIFNELSDYSKTVDFLPFTALKTIIDEMVDKAHVFKLIVLKNKLAKYDKLGYFASNKEDAEKLEQILLTNAVIDLSKLEPIFLNRYFSSIYKILSAEEKPSKVLVEVSNSLNKNNLKEIVMNKKVESIFISGSKFKYINDLKSMFSNFIIEPSFVNSEIFKFYKTFLTSMPQDTLLAVGTFTNQMPLVFIPEPYVSDTEKENLVSQNCESEQAKSTISIEVSEPEDSTTQAINAKSEQFIEKLSQEAKPLNSELMANIFTENADQEQDNEVVNEEASQTFGNEQEFHTEVSAGSEDAESQYSNTVQDVLSDSENADINESGEQTELVDISDEDIELNVIATEEEPVEQAVEEVVEQSTGEVNEVVDDSILQIESDEVMEEITDLAVDNQEASELLAENDLEQNSEELHGVIEAQSLDGTISTDDDVDKEIIADVDSIYTTMREEDISDSDLDFIDALNCEDLSEDAVSSENEQELMEESSALAEEGFEALDILPEEAEETAEFDEPIQELSEQVNTETTDDGILPTKEATTPMVPVYTAEIPQEDIVMSDEIYQGDTVTHAKYGTGVVEKMIKYGTKTLCSINFDNVGRRLLDPTLTEIKKV